ncbi:hypothetical protein HAX54_027575 [Datura stramonium]|uniref:Uncharacterized protein n=1 Tax=Datura stramonium TaxID=4076 RepID=A0ABS8V5U7_DATST|nr:hypothetical protein [Datura stramonium]
MSNPWGGSELKTLGIGREAVEELAISLKEEWKTKVAASAGMRKVKEGTTLRPFHRFFEGPLKLPQASTSVTAKAARLVPLSLTPTCLLPDAGYSREQTTLSIVNR